MSKGDWAKIIAFLAIVVLGIGWTIYFYTHMEAVCHFPLFVGSKECVGYNISGINHGR